MELEILALEPIILALEPRILAIGALNTGHWSPIFWPEMLPEDVKTFSKKIKSIGSYRISRCNFLKIMVFGWSIPLRLIKSILRAFFLSRKNILVKINPKKRIKCFIQLLKKSSLPNERTTLGILIG